MCIHERDTTRAVALGLFSLWAIACSTKGAPNDDAVPGKGGAPGEGGSVNVAGQGASLDSGGAVATAAGGSATTAGGSAGTSGGSGASGSGGSGASGSGGSGASSDVDGGHAGGADNGSIDAGETEAAAGRVSVTALSVTPTTGAPGASMTVNYTIRTSRSVTFTDLAAAVRDSTNTDDSHLDFAHHPNTTIAGTRTFTDARSEDHAGDFVVRIAYTLDGTHWTHVATPSASFHLATGSTPPPPPPPGGVKGPLSGLPWSSGVQSNFTSEQTAWKTYRGRPTDIAHVYTGRGSWADLTQPDYVFSNMSGYAGRLMLSVSPYPESLGQGAMTACAAGTYDSNWKTFGQSLVSHGRADTIVRIGWEFNGNWFPWSCTDPAAYKACFQHVARAIRGADASALFDWTLNAHYSQNPASHNAYDCYPGDDVVDIVGIDSYDMYPPSPDLGSWNAQCTGSQGLCALITFARTHGKHFSVGEWGVVSAKGGNGGMDNPFYIQKMYDTFAANEDILAYEAYFNNSDSGNVDSSLANPDQNPGASAKYKALFGAP